VPPIDPDIRAGIRALPVDASYAALSEADPVSAAKLKPRDSQRIARALEVVQSTGLPIGDWQQRTEGGIGNHIRVVPLVLLPPRPWLYARADARFAAMIEGGAIEEVDALVARGLDSALPVMRAIGVREIAAWRVGACDRMAMLAAAALATRRYAKRQFTWFAHQPPTAWPRVPVELDNAMIDELAIKLQYDALTH